MLMKATHFKNLYALFLLKEKGERKKMSSLKNWKKTFKHFGQMVSVQQMQDEPLTWFQMYTHVNRSSGGMM